MGRCSVRIECVVRSLNLGYALPDNDKCGCRLEFHSAIIDGHFGKVYDLWTVVAKVVACYFEGYSAEGDKGDADSCSEVSHVWDSAQFAWCGLFFF